MKRIKFHMAHIHLEIKTLFIIQPNQFLFIKPHIIHNFLNRLWLAYRCQGITIRI
jgi:hypothetical protein